VRGSVSSDMERATLMTHFTTERFLRLQNLDSEEAYKAGMAEWERAVADYDRQLNRLDPIFPPEVQQLSRHHLHDANVLVIAQSGDQLILELQMDYLPKEVVQLTYHLESEPEVVPDSLPSEYRSSRPQWMYDEIDAQPASLPGKGTVFLHNILLSDGKELKIRFKALDVKTAAAIYPVPTLIGSVPASAQPA
jgi:hypothetical protein